MSRSEIKEQKGSITMKKMIAFALSAVMALSLAACGGNGKTNGTSAQIPDPFTECETMEDAAKLVGFDVDVPDAVDGKERTAIRVDAEGKLVEVVYGNEDEKTVIRKAESSEDISGDYNQYANTEAVTIEDVEITFKGDGDNVSLATWTKDGYTYSISSGTGMTKIAMTDLVSAVENSDPMIIGGDPATWGPALDGEDGGDVQIPDPFTEYASMYKAAAAAGFDMMVPESVEGYSDRTIRVLSNDENGSMIEVICRNGDAENELRIRKAEGSEDISGDYNQYAESNTITVGELQVTMKGESGQVQLATWANNGYTYSIGIYDENGISSDAMAELVAAVR